jgi:hypothetical protein
MGETQLEQPVNLKRDEWVKRVLNIDLRARKIIGSIDKGAQVADPGNTQDGNTKSRNALVRRLALLKTEAVDFSAIAPRRNYADIADKIQGIQAQINGGQWDEAHKQITAVSNEIKQIAPGCRSLRDLRNNIQVATLKLDKLVGILLPDEFSALDKELLNLDVSVSLKTLDPGIEKLRELDEKIDRLKLAGEQRLGRIEMLRKQLPVAEGETTRLGVSAGELALFELEQRAKDLAEKLKQLAASDDEKALTTALANADTLREDSKEPFAQAELERRKRQLGDIRERMDETLENHEELLDRAVEGLTDTSGVDYAKSDLLQRLNAKPESDEVVKSALLAFDELISTIGVLQSDMDRVDKWQQLMKPRLEKYDPDEHDDDDKDALDNAYDDLPEEIKDPKASGWATAACWADEQELQPWKFLSAWAGRLKADQNAVDRDAYEQAVTEKPIVCNPYLQIARKASPTDRQSGKDLLDEITQLLTNAEDSEMLEPADAITIKDLFKQMNDLVDEIKDHIAEKRQEAKDIDDNDGAHSVARHGPDITDAQLQSRLKTGYSPDGIFSPAAKSSRFNSYDDLLYTRTRAFDEAADQANLSLAALFGAALDQAPDPGGAPARRRNKHSVTTDHPRVIGSGFIGKDVAQTFPSGGERYNNFDPLPPLTKTFSKIVWKTSETRWVAVQHFPTDA